MAVLALYRTQRAAFSEDELRLVELLAPRLATSLAMAVLAEEMPGAAGNHPVVVASAAPGQKHRFKISTRGQHCAAAQARSARIASPMRAIFVLK